jgi:hypothetical protein
MPSIKENSLKKDSEGLTPSVQSCPGFPTHGAIGKGLHDRLNLIPVNTKSRAASSEKNILTETLHGVQHD